MNTRFESKHKCMVDLVFSFLILFAVSAVFAGEVKYIYDDLGRLYQVIDSQGNVATYNYDPVGNLLSITRSTGGLSGPVVIGILPNSARAGDTVDVIISGSNLVGTAVSASNP